MPHGMSFKSHGKKKKTIIVGWLTKIIDHKLTIFYWPICNYKMLTKNFLWNFYCLWMGGGEMIYTKYWMWKLVTAFHLLATPRNALRPPLTCDR